MKEKLNNKIWIIKNDSVAKINGFGLCEDLIIYIHDSICMIDTWSFL